MNIAVRHQMPPIRNVIGSLMERVVVTDGPITASVARLGLGLNVSNNTLIGDTR